MLIAGSHKDVGIDYVQAQVDGRVSGGDECRTYHDKCPHSVFEVSECAGIYPLLPIVSRASLDSIRANGFLLQ